MTPLKVNEPILGMNIARLREGPRPRALVDISGGGDGGVGVGLIRKPDKARCKQGVQVLLYKRYHKLNGVFLVPRT